MKVQIKYTEQEIRNEFLSLIPELQKWGEFVDKILNDNVSSFFKSPEHLQMKASHRIKNIDSYCEKVFLRGKNYENPIYNITDKVGTRIVLLDTKDVEKVSSFVKRSKDWIVIEHSRDTEVEILQQPDVFTYQSDHFIVIPNDAYTTSVNKRYLSCEIQIRTILQHAYAEISHDTIYKKSTKTNNRAKRMLASSMALLEAADEKFIQIYDVMEDYNNLYSYLQKQIVDLYTNIVDSYDPNTYDVDIAHRMLSIYSESDITDMTKNIESFVKAPEYAIVDILTRYRQESIFFKHPIVLIALYGLSNLQNKTYVNWPFDSESLNKVIESLGLSQDSFIGY